MSRQTRLILVLGFVALLGVVALGTVAERYRGLLERRGGGAGDRARAEGGNAGRWDSRSSLVLSEVDRFIRVRRELESALPRDDHGVVDPKGLTATPDLEALRDRLIAKAGLTPTSYRRVRTAYRHWREGNGDLERSAASLFERRRVILDSVDLGDWERLDL